jgi:hypothetical protein
MNAVTIIGPEELSEGFSVERGCPDRDIGGKCVHHWLVHAGDVHSLFSMRHSECASALGVPLVPDYTLSALFRVSLRQDYMIFRIIM